MLAELERPPDTKSENITPQVDRPVLPDTHDANNAALPDVMGIMVATADTATDAQQPQQQLPQMP